MRAKKKKEFKGHIISMAISIAAGYFTAQIQINELFSLPVYVYTSISIFVGVLILYQALSFIRFLIVDIRDSKQEIPLPFAFAGRRPQGRYEINYVTFDNLMWRVEYHMDRKKIHEVYGPFCPQDECNTELNTRKTYFGKHVYSCPACSFSEKKDRNSYTIESDLKKVSKAQLNRKHGHEFELGD